MGPERRVCQVWVKQLVRVGERVLGIRPEQKLHQVGEIGHLSQAGVHRRYPQVGVHRRLPQVGVYRWLPQAGAIGVQ